jgi:hypothetical protein
MVFLIAWVLLVMVFGDPLFTLLFLILVSLFFFFYISSQFSRSTLDYVLSDSKLHKHGMPYEVINGLIFMDHFARLADIPPSVLHSFVPRAIYDTVGIA